MRAGVPWIGDAARWGCSVERRHVLARDRTPVDIRGIFGARPSLDSREQPLDARTVAAHVCRTTHILVDGPIGPQHGNEVFCTRQQKHVGARVIPVTRNTSIRPPADRGQGDRPADTTGTVSGPRVVGQCSGWREPEPPRTERERNRQPTRSRGRIVREGLAETAYRAAALGSRERWRRESRPHRGCHGIVVPPAEVSQTASAWNFPPVT